MVIRGADLTKACNLFKKKDAGFYIYKNSMNIIFMGSFDTITGHSLLDTINFSEKEQETLSELGIQYDPRESVWYFSLYNLNKKEEQTQPEINIEVVEGN